MYAMNPVPPCTEPGRWPDLPLPEAPDHTLDAFSLHAETCPHHAAVLSEMEALVQGVVCRMLAAPDDVAVLLPPVPEALSTEGAMAPRTTHGVGYASLVFACLFVLLLIFSFSFYDAPAVRATPQQAQPCPLLYCGPSL